MKIINRLTFLLITAIVSAHLTALADPPVLTDLSYAGNYATLKLKAWPGDYAIQTTTNFTGVWQNETNISVGCCGTAVVTLPLNGRASLLIRAVGQSPSDGRGCQAQFLTLGSSFEPEVMTDSSALQNLFWIWSDGTTTTDHRLASKDFGSEAARWQGLLIQPSNALTSINLGFDGADGGGTTPLNHRPAQNVGAVRFAYPLPSLRYWASSYNPIAGTLDFSGFTSLEAIECFRCTPLQHVVMTNLPSLKRVCLESCDLRELDLSGNPNLEDVRTARNAYTHIRVDRGTGPKIRHWCVGANPQLTQQFADIMTNFYSLQQLIIWDDNQRGTLTTVSTNLAGVWAYDNLYSAADFTGQSDLSWCEIYNNVLTNLVLTGCSGLQYLDAHNNQFNTEALDNLLAFLDTSAPKLQTVNLTGNPEYPSAIGYSHYASLTNRGVTVYLDWMNTNSIPGGANAITFVTTSRNPHLELRTEYGTPASIIWHWGDGTITTNALLADHDFGTANRYTNYVEVIPPTCVSYFGAQRTTVDQGIAGVFGAANFPNLNYLFLYRESLRDLSLAGCSNLVQLHLAGNPVSRDVCDQWFIDLDQAVKGPVTNADFWYPASRRSSASDTAWTNLVNKGYIMHP